VVDGAEEVVKVVDVALGGFGGYLGDEFEF
jgi:hypothetical protein